MRVLDAEALKGFVATVRRDIPKFRVAFKDESKLMAVLAFLAYPFNPAFLESYTTTWGNTVYFPTKSFYVSNPAVCFRILAHEYVHLVDTKLHPWTFKLSYMFPQVLVVLPLIVFGVLAWPYSWIVLLPFVSYIVSCAAARLTRILFWVLLPLLLIGTGVLAWWLTGWWALVLVGVLLFVVPWPAYWRTKWELRGYGMNVALVWWLYKKFSAEQVKSIVGQFTGPSYFFMCWSRSKVEGAMRGYYVLAESSELREEYPYSVVHAFLRGDS